MTRSTSPTQPVSVVVPTHARPRELREAVVSVLHQDYRGPIEIIVVFDGSEPFELDLPNVPERSIQVIRNGRVRGLAGARNSGIAAASHPWVAFLDDDDVWLSNKLSAQMRLVESMEGPVPPLIGCGIIMVTPAAEVARPLPSARIGYQQLLADRVAALHSSGLLLRPAELLEGGVVIDEGLPGSYAEDYDLLLRAARNHGIPVVPEPLVRVTFSGGSHFAEKWNTIAQALEYLLRKHPDIAANSRRGYARVCGQIAFALAASDKPAEARSWAFRACRANPMEKRAHLAGLVSTGAIEAGQVQHWLQARGRGV